MRPRANRVALLLLCTASFMTVADTTIVTIALPSMRDALGFAPARLGVLGAVTVAGTAALIKAVTAVPQHDWSRSGVQV